MHYYLKNENNEIVATVALLRNGDGKWSRGIAIRSKQDSPNKEIGRSIAGSRALKAQECCHRTHVRFSSSVYYTALKRLRDEDKGKVPDRDLGYKMFPDATLSDFEKHILKRYHKIEV
jgi:hypothetical protein